MPVIHDEVDHDSPLFRMRHSLSHVLAQAVQNLYPGTVLGFGPPIDDGFYYDFILPKPISDEDLPAIQNEMRRIIKDKQDFVREELTPADALSRLEGMREPHKIEYAKELVQARGVQSLSFYTNGPFVDMCEGPHVDNTGDLPFAGFKLHSTAGAYWRGDERNQMLTRIYAWAYPDKKELRAREQEIVQAKKRDHRKLAKQLSIFAISDDVGKGLPLWLPAGAVLRRELEQLSYEMEFAAGYVNVATPHITKAKLFETSGHLSLYDAGMYPPMTLSDEGDDGQGGASERYYLKPMNCPHHHMVYAAQPRSYRDLPLRLSEYGTVYRYERAGTLQGITRVRGMTMNDAHIYVTPDQLKDEFIAVLDLHTRYYELFGLSDYFLRLSLWDPDDPKRKSKYVDDPDNWAKTEALVTEALEEYGAHYKLGHGEAAFYGPKVDYQFRTALDKEYTLSTNQLDFAVPPRFNLTYTDNDGADKTPYCIHRAPLSTHERFIAFLIEHYGGAFPTWLAPEQVRLVPVSDKHVEYARKVKATLRADLVRCEVDDSDATMGKKIRTGATAKVPMLLIVGDQEVADESVTVRRYGIAEQRTMPASEMAAMVLAEIKRRAHVTEW